MIDGWAETTLGEVLVLQYGKGLKKADRDGGPFPVYGSAGVLGFHSEALVEETPAIVVGRKGSAGSVHWAEAPCWPIDTTYWVEPRMSVDMGFLKLLLEHVDLPSICAQTGVPGLNRDRVYELKVALPPLMEQQRIVDLLDAVEGVQTAVRSVERDGDRAYHAVLEDQFNVLAEKTRSEVPLGEVLTRERRPIDVEPTSLYEEIGIRSHGKGIFHKAPKTGLEIGKKRIFSIEPGDLVFNIVFAWEGAVALAGPEEAGRCASHRFPTYRTEHDVTAEFLLHFFRTRRGRSYLDLASPGSAGRNRTLNRGMLMEMTVPDAPVDQQREVVQSLVAVEELRDRATAYGEASAKAQSSLLQDLLTGHHRVPESYDGILENAS